MVVSRVLRSLCIGITCVVSCSIGRAQQQEVERLRNELSQQDSASSAYAHTLLKICATYIEHNPDSALQYCKLSLAVPHGNDSLRAQTYIKTSTAYSHKGAYDKSAELVMQGLTLGEKIGDTLAIFDAHTNLGIDFFIQEEYESAKSHFDKAEQMIFSYGDSSRLGHAINNLGLVIGYLEGSEEEIPQYERAREIFRRVGNQEGYANTVMNLGTAYSALERYEEAIEAFNQALQIYKDINYSAAEEQAYLNLGETYLAMREFKKGLEATHMALSISKRYSYRLDELYAIDLLGKIHAGLQRYDSAYFYKTKYGSLKDSLFNIERENIRSELQTRYETEKKEQQIVQLQQDSIIKDLQVREEKQWRNNLIMLAGFLGIIAVLFYSRFRTKKRATDMLNQKNEELKELNGFKDKLFTVISHDLKSPLSAFSNLTRSLADNVKHLKQEEIEEYLRNLNVSSMDLTRLLNNLLEWALTQTGSISYNPAIIRCDELVEEVITQLRPSLQEKKIVLNNFVPEKTEAFADKNMIVIVLRNLLSNAIKFSNVGGVITIFAGRKDNLVTLGVKDEGIGISMEDQAKLFKASGEVHTVGNSNAKGTGIGLMLCRELVERNGGNIYVESKLGDGSNFYFSLPVTNLAK